MSAFAAAMQSSTDPAAALGALRRQVHALTTEPLVPAQRFARLEALRAHAIALTRAQRAIYAGMPVPLEDRQQSAWENALGTWQSFYFAYALCADAGLEPQAAATVSQRALDSLGRAIREHAFVYRAVPAALWKELHTCYRSAAECGLAEIAVADPHEPISPPRCNASYLHTLLHDSADLHALDAPQMLAVAGWLPAWVAQVRLVATPPPDARRSPLAVDLGGEGGARALPPASAGSGMHVRYLDNLALGSHLRALAEDIRSARPAPELQDTDLPPPALERLLTHLYVQWCSPAGTQPERQARDAVRAQVGVGMHAVHFQVSGRAFRQPGSRYTREEEHDLATFGHITERTEHRLLTGRSAALEPWEIAHEGLAAQLTLRRKPDLAARIRLGQLLAVRTSSSDPPRVGLVQKLRVEVDGSLTAVLRAFRQELRGAAVRAAGDPLQKYERALLLDAAAGGDESAVLVEPGRFRSGSRLELHTNRTERVRVVKIVDCGPDCQRLVVEPC